MVGRCWKMIWGEWMADFQERTLNSFKEKIYPKKSSNRSGKGSCTFASASIFFSSSFFFTSNLSPSQRDRTNLKLLYFVGSNQGGKTRPHRKTTKTLSDSFHPKVHHLNFFGNPICPENRKKPSSCSACTSNSA